MKKSILSLLLALCVLGQEPGFTQGTSSWFGGRPSQNFQKLSQAAVILFDGQIFIQRAGSGAAEPVLSAPTMIRIGDQVQTRKGSATVRFEDMSEIKLSPGAVFVMQTEEPKHINIFLTLGKLWASVTKNPGRSFEVTTPVAVASVRGTQFSVEVRNVKETITQVQSGLVMVRGFSAGNPIAGEGILLHSGESVNVLGGKVGIPGSIQSSINNAAPRAPSANALSLLQKMQIQTVLPLSPAAIKADMAREIGLQFKQEAVQTTAVSASANPMTQEGGNMIRMAAYQQALAAAQQAQQQKPAMTSASQGSGSTALNSNSGTATVSLPSMLAGAPAPTDITMAPPSVEPTVPLSPTMMPPPPIDPTSTVNQTMTQPATTSTSLTSTSPTSTTSPTSSTSPTSPTSPTSSTSQTSPLTPTSPTYTTTCPTCPTMPH